MLARNVLARRISCKKRPGTRGVVLRARVGHHGFGNNNIILKRAAYKREGVEIERAGCQFDQSPGWPPRGVPARRLEHDPSESAKRSRDRTTTTTSIQSPDADSISFRSTTYRHKSTHVVGSDDSHRTPHAHGGRGELNHRRADAVRGARTVRVSPKVARCSRFSPVEYAHGTEASSASVQSHSTLYVSREGALAYWANAPSHSDPNVQHSNGR